VDCERGEWLCKSGEETSRMARLWLVP
jgi:hypothetical protein